MGSASAGKVYTVAYAHYNMGGDIQRLLGEFKKKMNDDLTQASIFHAFALLDNAFVQTKSTDPVKVAAALEGAARAGLREGDIILAIANTEVSGVKDFDAILGKVDKSKTLSVLYRRGEWAQYALIRPVPAR
eukprot:gene46565-58058_t